MGAKNTGMNDTGRAGLGGITQKVKDFLKSRKFLIGSIILVTALLWIMIPFSSENRAGVAFVILLAWLGQAVLASFLAMLKHRSVWTWLMLGIFTFSISSIVLLFLSDEGAKETQLKSTPQAVTRYAPGPSAQQYFEKGAKLGEAQQWPQAIELLREAVRLDPNHAKAHMGLVMCYGGAMDLENARKHFEILQRLDPALAYRVAQTPAGMLILRTGNIIKG